MTDPCLTTGDVAELLGVSDTYVRQEILAGRLECDVLAVDGKRRRLYRVSPAAVDAYRQRFKWSSGPTPPPAA